MLKCHNIFNGRFAISKMRLLYGEGEKKAIVYFLDAAKTAESATCLKDKCGAVIVKDNKIISRGFNHPPANTKPRCLEDKSKYHPKVTDKTCCIHAENHAISNALKGHPKELIGSSLYFIRLGKDGEITKAGKPYCTLCSKNALEEGIKEFVLWHNHGMVAYGTEEYDDISHSYKE